MTDTSKCVACGGETIPFKSPEKMYTSEIAKIKIVRTIPQVPMFSLFICSRCGYWNMFSFEMREAPRKLSQSEKEKVEKDFGLIS